MANSHSSPPLQTALNSLNLRNPSSWALSPTTPLALHPGFPPPSHTHSSLSPPAAHTNNGYNK